LFGWLDGDFPTAVTIIIVGPVPHLLQAVFSPAVVTCSEEEGILESFISVIVDGRRRTAMSNGPRTETLDLILY
jgi:hypothetical protein